MQNGDLGSPFFLCLIWGVSPEDPLCRLSFLAANHEFNTMKRKHILTQRRFILMPNIAWASER